MFSLFGRLDKFSWWRDLSYPPKGTILRALKAGLSVSVGIIIAALSQGVIMFPAAWSPFIILIVTTLLQSIDKYLRETQIAKTAATTDAAIGPDQNN
jgi:hypothetical protein